MGSYQSRMYTVYIYKYIYQAIVEDKESYEYAYMHICMCVVYRMSHKYGRIVILYLRILTTQTYRAASF